jgi:hypothetical protein
VRLATMKRSPSVLMGWCSFLVEWVVEIPSVGDPGPCFLQGVDQGREVVVAEGSAGLSGPVVVIGPLDRDPDDLDLFAVSGEDRVGPDRDLDLGAPIRREPPGDEEGVGLGFLRGDDRRGRFGNRGGLSIGLRLRLLLGHG